MKNLVICLVSMLFLLQSCDGWGIFDGGNSVTGKGNIERVSRAVVGFKAVHLQSSANVFIRQGTAFKVEVEAQKNIADIFETVVEDSVLVLKFKNGTHNIRFDKLNIYVEMPNIEGIEVAGSGEPFKYYLLTADPVFKHSSFIYNSSTLF